MAGEINRAQAMAMQAALAKLREEDEARKLGEFRATHGGWSPNQGGFTYGLGAEVNPAGFGPQPQAAPRPVNKPQFLVPDYTPEQMQEVIGTQPGVPMAEPQASAPQALAPAPTGAAPAAQGMQRPVAETQTPRSSKDNRSANAAFRRFMTTFGGQRGGR